jgi:hypothetical protein
VSFAAITLCVGSQRVFIVVIYFVMTQSGNFWIHSHRKQAEIKMYITFLLANLKEGTAWETQA